MHNPLRSEATLTLGDKEYRLRPSIEMIAQLEAELNKSIWAIISDLGNPRTIMLNHMVAIIRHGMSGSGMKDKDIPSRKDVLNLLVHQGPASVVGPLLEWLTKSVASDEELEAQAKRVREASGIGATVAEVAEDEAKGNG